MKFNEVLLKGFSPDKKKRTGWSPTFQIMIISYWMAGQNCLSHNYNACYLIWLTYAIQRKLSNSAYHSLVYKVSNKCCSRNAKCLIIALETTSELDDKPSQQQFSNIWELWEQNNLIKISTLYVFSGLTELAHQSLSICCAIYMPSQPSNDSTEY